MEVYEIVRSIGSGSFGQVYLAKHKREDKLYVIKKIKTRDMQTKDRENTEQEVRLLQKLRHTNIVAYKDSFMDQDQYLNIVMIYCEGGDMYNKIRNSKGKNFSENQVLDWFAQMALALYYLHDKKILHRDLKTQNIFLKHGRVRLGDFGIAKVLDSTRDFANTCIGTPYYMSPELFKYKPYSYKSDVWALGCVMYEICNLRHAFDAQSFQGLAAKIIKGSYPPITPTYSKQLRDLIGKMLSLNPKDRPTIVDVLQKPILKRRVVNYIAEIFSGKYPEANMVNDVDDIYVDSLRDQAENLGIMSYIQEAISKNENPDKFIELIPDDNAKEFVPDKKDLVNLKAVQGEVKKAKKELRVAVEEKKKIETELSKLKKKEEIQKKIVSNEKFGIKDRHQSQDKLKKLNEKIEEGKPIIDGKDLKADKNKKPPTKITPKIENSIEEKPKISIHRENSNPENLAKKPSNALIIKDVDEEKSGKPRKYSAENASTEASSDKNSELVGKKELVMIQKEKKKREEQERMEKELKEIRLANFEARKLANEKKNAMYRPSNDLFGMENKLQDKKLVSPNNGGNTFYQTNQASTFSVNERETPGSDFYKSIESSNEKPKFEEKKSEKALKIEEDYAMNDEIPDDDEDEEENMILEEEDEDDDAFEKAEKGEENPQKRAEKIDLLLSKLNEKTMRVNEIKQTLKKSIQIQKTLINKTQGNQIMELNNYSDDSSSSIDLELDDEEEDSTEETLNPNENDVQEKKTYHPQYYKILDRIKLLRHRCEAGIGGILYEKSYKFLSENGASLKQEEIRKTLIDILGEENIGFWHLIDQILLFEDFAKKFQ